MRLWQRPFQMEVFDVIEFKNLFSTDLSVSSPQLGLITRSDSSFHPESCSLFPLSSSSLRWEGLDLRAEAREAQLISDKLQEFNLNKEYKMEIKIHSDKNHIMLKEAQTEYS